MKKEIREIGPFKQIHFKDFGDLILIQGDKESLTIEAEEEILSELTAEVRDDKLILGIEDDWFSRLGKMISSVFTSTDYKVVYTLTFVDLEKIQISGKCNLECDSVKVDDLSLRVSGLGNLRFAHLDCDFLDIVISGRGEFSAAGRADQQQVRISGSGEYEAPHLSSQSVQIVISGQGKATLRVAESLDITISGLGQINYYGQPKIRQVISGVGKSNRLSDG